MKQNLKLIFFVLRQVGQGKEALGSPPSASGSYLGPKRGYEPLGLAVQVPERQFSTLFRGSPRRLVTCRPTTAPSVSAHEAPCEAAEAAVSALRYPGPRGRARSPLEVSAKINGARSSPEVGFPRALGVPCCGSGRFWKVVEGSGRFRKVPEGLGIGLGGVHGVERLLDRVPRMVRDGASPRAVADITWA